MGNCDNSGAFVLINDENDLEYDDSNTDENQSDARDSCSESGSNIQEIGLDSETDGYEYLISENSDDDSDDVSNGTIHSPSKKRRID